MILGWGKVAAFVGGTCLGSAGVKILISKDAKKIYVHPTAAMLRTAVIKAAIKQNLDFQHCFQTEYPFNAIPNNLSILLDAFSGKKSRPIP